MATKDPWMPTPFHQLPQEVDRLFDELIHRRWGAARSHIALGLVWTPQLDLYEDATAFVLEADLPGVKEQDISVTVENDRLILQGKRDFERVSATENFHFHERRSGTFLRRLQLPTSVDRDKIRVEFHDGVLLVTLPKVQTERTPRS